MHLFVCINLIQVFTRTFINIIEIVVMITYLFLALIVPFVSFTAVSTDQWPVLRTNELNKKNEVK